MSIVRFILFVIVIKNAGCSKTEDPTTSVLPDSAVRISNVQDALDAAFTDSQLILFQSWNGKWIGMDCDTNIELNVDGGVMLTEYGYAISEYNGTYSITTAADSTRSVLTIALEDYFGTWPAMAVYTDQSKLLLMPIDSSGGFIMGNRGGAYIPGDAGSFWPFRQIQIPSPDE